MAELNNITVEMAMEFAEKGITLLLNDGNVIGIEEEN